MSVCHPYSSVDTWSQELRLCIADSLFNNASEGICITDATERIVEVNPTFCALTGYSRAELLGQTPRILRSGLQNEDYYQCMWQSLLGSGEWHGELWNRHKAGHLYAVRINVAAICDASAEVTHYLAMMADITAMKVQQQEWQKNANHDGLTGLPNRILLTDRLTQAMAQSLRTGLLLAICYLDLDGFKPVNDVHGHAAGDKVLVAVAERLSSSVREGDTIARVGGDEFVLLLWGLDDIQECEQTLSRLIAEIDQPIDLGNAMVSVTISAGVTMFPSEGVDPTLLIAQADSAMYRSKMAGGNRFTHFRSPH